MTDQSQDKLQQRQCGFLYSGEQCCEDSVDDVGLCLLHNPSLSAHKRAGSLNNLGNRLSELGRREEALKAADEVRAESKSKAVAA